MKDSNSQDLVISISSPLIFLTAYLQNTDPEEQEYHPAQRLKKKYNYVEKSYDKHAHEVNSIMSNLDKSDFELLLELEKCASFNSF